MHAEHQHLRIRQLRPDVTRGVDAANTRQRAIHHHHFRFQLERQPHCFQPLAGLNDDRNRVIILAHPPHAYADHPAIVPHQNRGLTRHALPLSPPPPPPPQPSPPPPLSPLRLRPPHAP